MARSNCCCREREVVEVLQGRHAVSTFARINDGLITIMPATQLTWMDVKVDGYVPTPRHGKPVEINALWLNALIMLAELGGETGAEMFMRAPWSSSKLADQVAGNFVKAFWFADGNYLYDVIQGDFRDSTRRPNQIFAVSLPYSPLDKTQQKAVLDVVTEQLLTPYGLRSLTPKSDKYCPKYTGNQWQRDCAYHQGTVWPWLIGPYCDAYAKVSRSRQNAAERNRQDHPAAARPYAGSWVGKYRGDF